MANILIIDDDPDIRFLAINILKKEGHTVVEAASGIKGSKRSEKRSRI